MGMHLRNIRIVALLFILFLAFGKPAMAAAGSSARTDVNAVYHNAGPLEIYLSDDEIFIPDTTRPITGMTEYVVTDGKPSVFRISHCTYDAEKNLVQIVSDSAETSQNTLIITYNANHQPLTYKLYIEDGTVDEFGDFVYGKDGKCQYSDLHGWEGSIQHSTYLYNNLNQIIKASYKDSTTSGSNTYAYNSSGKPLSKSNTQGDRVVYSYDAEGNIISSLYTMGSLPTSKYYIATFYQY
ncbi:MAG: hypothetical protein LKJ76_09920 [Lachnospiraceae bacterium]|nr:hypothetical protein [Lachnospiraceae bacterium]